MRFMKKIIIAGIGILFSLSCCLHPLYAQEEAVPYMISSYKIRMNIKDNGLIQVHEQIDISNCEDLMLARVIPTVYKVAQNDVIFEQDCSLTNVSVPNHDYTITEEDITSKINIVLSKKTETIDLSYNLQLDDFQLENQQLLYYTLFTGFQGSILSFEAEITFPEIVNFPIQLINEQGQLVSDYQMTSEENKVFITTRKSISFGSHLAIQAILPAEYFTFGFTVDYQLLSALLSVLLVCGSFLVYMGKGRTGRKKRYLSHPPKGVPTVLYGYIADGYMSDKDFFPLLVEWANKGYIWIEESSQNIHILLRKELPASSPAYEKLFFDAIFGKKTDVDLYDLENKDFTLIFDELKEMVYDMLCRHSKQGIYRMNHIYHQISCCLLAGLPMFFAVLAAYYTESLQLFQALLPACAACIGVSLTCIPWVYLVIKYPVLSQKSRKGIFTMIAVIQSSVLFVISYNLLNHHMNFLYIIIHVLMTILFMLDLFALDRRTKKGSRYYRQIQALDNFVHQSRVAQIDELVYREPNYYYNMLPYAVALDVLQIWSGKFAALMIEKPFWFLTPRSSAQSMYWVEPLVYAVEDIATAILQHPSHARTY